MLAYVKRVDVSGLDADWPRSVTIQKLAIDKAVGAGRARRRRDLPCSRCSCRTGSRGRPSPAPAPRRAPTPADAPARVTVKSLAVDEGSPFVDRGNHARVRRGSLAHRGQRPRPRHARGTKGQSPSQGGSPAAPVRAQGDDRRTSRPGQPGSRGRLTDFPLPRVQSVLEPADRLDRTSRGAFAPRAVPGRRRRAHPPPTTSSRPARLRAVAQRRRGTGTGWASPRHADLAAQERQGEVKSRCRISGNVAPPASTSTTRSGQAGAQDAVRVATLR